MPGLSMYCIAFVFEGEIYKWDIERHCFVNEHPNYIKRFNTVPPGASLLKFTDHDPEVINND